MPGFEDHNFGVVTRTTTYDMSPKQWHYRVPFFGKYQSAANKSLVDMNGNTPAAMSAEPTPATVSVPFAAVNAMAVT